MQCAAVISRSLSGLATTLAVPEWLPLALCSNSAPTRSAGGEEPAACDWPRWTPPPSGMAASSRGRFQNASAPMDPCGRPGGPGARA